MATQWDIVWRAHWILSLIMSTTLVSQSGSSPFSMSSSSSSSFSSLSWVSGIPRVNKYFLLSDSFLVRMRRQVNIAPGDTRMASGSMMTVCLQWVSGNIGPVEKRQTFSARSPSEPSPSTSKKTSNQRARPLMTPYLLTLNFISTLMTSNSPSSAYIVSTAVTNLGSDRRSFSCKEMICGSKDFWNIAASVAGLKSKS